MTATEQSDRLKAGYEFRRCNLSDLNWLMRAQAASNFELDAESREEVAAGLLTGYIEAYILTREKSRTGIVIRREGIYAQLIAFYREGSPVGLWADAQVGWAKITDVLQEDGVREVRAYIHRKNPQLKKLVRFYKRFAFDWDTVRLSRQV